MFEKDKVTTSTQPVTIKKPIQVTIIGGGAAALGAAEHLAAQVDEFGNSKFHVVILEKSEMFTGASGRNPGRQGHGFHYADLETALTYLRESIRVQRKYPGFHDVPENAPADSVFRHGHYFITKDTNVPIEKILETYRGIEAEYKRLVEEDPANEVFGPPEKFMRFMDPSEYEHQVNADKIQLGVETAETLFNWPKFAEATRQRLNATPNIELREFCEVTNLERNLEEGARFKITINNRNGIPEGGEGKVETYETDYIVNSTWEKIKHLEHMLKVPQKPGQKPEKVRTNRLKALVVYELPPELQNTNSKFFCMGQHCMLSVKPNGIGMGTYAKETNRKVSTAIEIEPDMQRFLDGKISDEEKFALGERLKAGMIDYIPGLKNAKIKDVKFGIIQTPGELKLEDLSDSSNSYNTRKEFCVEQGPCLGIIANPSMKLFYFLKNGELVGELLETNILVDQKIDAIIDALRETMKKSGYNLEEKRFTAMRRWLELKEPADILNDKKNWLDETTTKLKRMLSKNNFITTSPLNAQGAQNDANSACKEQQSAPSRR